MGVRATVVTVGLLGAGLLLASCGTGDDADDARGAGGSGRWQDRASAAATPTPDDDADTVDDGHGGRIAAPDEKPLRDGERRLSLAMPAAYTPSPPTEDGTDDYRCFLLDPDLETGTSVTGVDVRPGNPRVVHHVILYRVPADQVASAEAEDDATDGQGWTCFGGTGMGGGQTGLDNAPWLGAWAPGGGESVMRPGYGVTMEPGDRVVMQVHYNLLAGDGEDVSAAQLRVADRAPDGGPVTPVTTMLLPAPVELPCRPEHGDGPLCSRDAAVADVRERFGDSTGSTADLLHLLCGGDTPPGQSTTCDRTVREPATILGAAGHMHLLGRSISIEVNPGTPRARTLLDIGVWDFDNQQARRVPAYDLRAGDTVRVSCRHDQAIRDVLPALAEQEERYVVWGEGSTDEMCLGILQVAPGRSAGR